MRRSLGNGVVVLMVGILSSCGASTNVNQLWADDDGADSLMTKARIAYDQGRFEEALESAEKAVDTNPNNEKAAILVGYIYLSMGGIDPYQLARKLTSLSSDKSGSGANLQDDGESESSDGAADTLGELGDLINLTAKDYETLGSPYDSNGSGLFDDATIIVPATVNDALRAAVPTLDYMSKAVMAVCRFVDDSTKSETDTRHANADCTQVENTRTQSAKAHFLWAFTHLTETLVYQSVLLYSGASSGGSSFSAASEKLQDYTEISAFNTALDDLTSATDQVFATEAEDGVTMISATLDNLETVERAFAALAGLPDNISESLTKSLDKIREVGEDATSGEAVGNLTALKGEMTKKFASKVSEKIETALSEQYTKLGIDPGTKVSDIDTSEVDIDADELEELTDVCDSYSGLVEGVEDKDKKTPAVCE